jgi:hypothetical protein
MAYVFHVIPIGQKHMMCEKRGKEEEEWKFIGSIVTWLSWIIRQKWTLNEQSMVQIQKVLSKHQALNPIVLHNHYYQKHALKK